MASLQTIVLDSGKAELLEPDIIAFPKYFKLSSSDIPALSSSNPSDYSFWFQKNIDIYKVIDQDTIEFTCILEAVSNTNDTKSICLFFENPNKVDGSGDTPFLLGVLNEPLPSGIRVVLTIQFKLTNATSKINFSFITSDQLEEGLLSLNTLITLGNQITKNSTILSKIYLPDVLDTPNITSETFSIT